LGVVAVDDDRVAALKLRGRVPIQRLERDVASARQMLGLVLPRREHVDELCPLPDKLLHLVAINCCWHRVSLLSLPWSVVLPVVVVDSSAPRWPDSERRARQTWRTAARTRPLRQRQSTGLRHQGRAQDAGRAPRPAPCRPPEPTAAAGSAPGGRDPPPQRTLPVRSPRACARYSPSSSSPSPSAGCSVAPGSSGLTTPRARSAWVWSAISSWAMRSSLRVRLTLDDLGRDL